MANPPSRQNAKAGCPAIKPQIATPTTGSSTQSKTITFPASTRPGYLRFRCDSAALSLKLRLLIHPYHNTPHSFRKLFSAYFPLICIILKKINLHA